MPKLEIAEDIRSRLRESLQNPTGGIIMSPRTKMVLARYRLEMREKYKDTPSGRTVWVVSPFATEPLPGHILVEPNDIGLEPFCTVRVTINGQSEVHSSVLYYANVPNEIPGMYAYCHPREE